LLYFVVGKRLMGIVMTGLMDEIFEFVFAKVRAGDIPPEIVREVVAQQPDSPEVEA